MDKIYEKLDYPQTLFVEPTNFCNIRCSICPYEKMTRRKGNMSWGTLRVIIEESKGQSKVCYFMGFGEPLLHPEIIPMIEYIESEGIAVYLSTNSMLLDEETIHKLFDTELTRLYLPLSSLNKETYEKIRCRADFKTVIKNIENCIRIRKIRRFVKTKVFIVPIAMKETIDEFDEIAEKYRPFLEGIGGVELKSYCTYAGAVEDKSVACHKTPPGFCTMMNYGINIYWNGDVSICCNDYDCFTLVGNVRDKNIKEIWDSVEYENHRFMGNDFCKRCLNEN
jgi:organic radical activating enzyme